MPLMIRAVKNNLGSSASPYYALAAWSDLIENDKFIDRMAEGRTTISKTEILAVFQLAREELTSLLAEGCYVKTPFGAAIPRATGTFATLNDTFQPKRKGSGHTVRFDFQLDPKIESEALAKLTCERMECLDQQSPKIISITSIQSGCEGETRPGDLVRIKGKRLKFDASDESQGMFLCSTNNEEKRISLYASIRPSEVVAAVPADLLAGDYRVIVRTVSRGGTRLEGRGDGKVKVGN